MFIISIAGITAMSGRWSDCEDLMDNHQNSSSRIVYTPDLPVGLCLNRSLGLQCQAATLHFTVSHKSSQNSKVDHLGRSAVHATVPHNIADNDSDLDLKSDEVDHEGRPPVFCRSGPEEPDALDLNSSLIYSTFPFNRRGLQTCAAFFPLNGTEHFRHLRLLLMGGAEEAPALERALAPAERCRVAIGVMSAPSKPGHREAVRQAWGKVSRGSELLQPTRAGEVVKNLFGRR
jgi:hypothetical protein